VSWFAARDFWCTVTVVDCQECADSTVCDAVKEATFFRRSTVLVVDILRAALCNTDHLGTVPIGSGFLNKALSTRCAPLPGGTID